MKARLVASLSGHLPQGLAEELVEDFIVIRQDVASSTFGRSAPGKFVETFVQVLQYLHSGTYDAKPNADRFLRSVESSATSLDDGLRICAARIARSMYTLRNKRSIAHKGDVDLNQYDLRYLHHAAQWILAEIVRSVSGLPMEEAGRLVQQIQAPVGSLVEDFGDRKLVLVDLSTPKEILVLLHSKYPDPLTSQQILDSVDRRIPKTVKSAIRSLWRGKLIEGDSDAGYKLTRAGLEEATKIVAEAVAV